MEPKWVGLGDHSGTFCAETECLIPEGFVWDNRRRKRRGKISSHERHTSLAYPSLPPDLIQPTFVCIKARTHPLTYAHTHDLIGDGCMVTAEDALQKKQKVQQPLQLNDFAWNKWEEVLKFIVKSHDQKDTYNRGVVHSPAVFRPAPRYATDLLRQFGFLRQQQGGSSRHIFRLEVGNPRVQGLRAKKQLACLNPIFFS